MEESEKPGAVRVDSSAGGAAGHAAQFLPSEVSLVKCNLEAASPEVLLVSGWLVMGVRKGSRHTRLHTRTPFRQTSQFSVRST